MIGVPHADFGEGVVAVLVEKSNEKIDSEGIAEALSATIAKFKQPKKYVVVSELPRNAMGKVQKNVMRDSYTAIFSE